MTNKYVIDEPRAPEFGISKVDQLVNQLGNTYEIQALN